MVDSEKVTNAAGQKITVFNADQQLYSVVLDIMWADRDRWMFFVLRLGGMHWLMSFIGSVDALMAGSGLKEILSSGFSVSDKMLQEKKFPMNLKAFRFVVIELLRGHVKEMGSYDEMECWFSQLCKTSFIAEHWIKNFIKPLLLMLLYVRAKREGEFRLHLYVCKQMMPYFFFAEGHFNYVRYGLCYINSMEKLLNEIFESFMKGEDVNRHKR